MVDYQNRQGYKISVYIDYIYEGPDQFPVHRASRMPLSSAEEEAFELFFEVHDEAKIPGGELIIDESNVDTFGSLGVSMDFQINSSGEKESLARLGTIKYYIPPREHPNDTAFDAFQFMTDSSMRKMLYRHHMTSISVRLIDAFNVFTNVFNLGNFNLRDVGGSYDIVFPNGSTVVAYPDPTNLTMVFIENSGFDADENQIPNPNSRVFTDNQSFTSEENAMRMHNYLVDFWNLEPINPFPQCQAYSVRLKFEEDGRIVYVIDRCLY